MLKPGGIGFDRPVDLEWLDAIAGKVSQGANPDETRPFLFDLLKGLVAGEAKNSARGKTVTVLAHIWSRVPPNLVDLRDRAAALIPESEQLERVALHWAMMTATYPFFCDLTTNTGRLLGLQGDFAFAQLLRRLREQWGDRSTLRPAIQRIVRSMVQWGILVDTSQLGVYRQNGSVIDVPEAIAELLVEALPLTKTEGVFRSLKQPST